MKVKVVLLVLVALVLGTINTMFDLVIHPTLAANVAVDQLKDDDTAAAVMRSYDVIANLLPVVLVIMFLGVGILVFRSEIRRATRGEPIKPPVRPPVSYK